MLVWRNAFIGPLVGGALLLAAATGCGDQTADLAAEGPISAKVVPVTVAPLEHRAVERTVEVIGTLRGWEQVTLGSKRSGRVTRVYHDIGDRVPPGEPLVELDPVDARLEVQQAESKYLGELIKLGITERQAEDFVRKYGFSEQLVMGPVVNDAIARSPSVVEKRLVREKKQQYLSRQRALTQRGAGTAQDLDDAENDFRTAAASYESAVQAARTVIANAFAAKVAFTQAEQMLKDMVISAPVPKLLPPSLTRTSALAYGVTKRHVSEGQMIREGDAVVELVIEDPIRLWSNVPEQYSEEVRVGQRVRLATRAHPGVSIDGKVARINPSVDSSNRTFQVETIVPNERGLLRPGGFAKASIITDAVAQAAVVPLDAIVQFAGVTKLFIVENGKARSISDIKTGTEGRGWIEVTSKLLPDTATVITTGQSHLSDGINVLIREAEAVTPPKSSPAGPVPETAATHPAPSRR